MLVKYVSIDGIPQTFVFFRFVDTIDITVHDRFWNVGQANCILKYFENMMIFMYAMNIQNDVIGLVLRENCKSKQMTDSIA
jgi:hypothetical protein